MVEPKQAMRMSSLIALLREQRATGFPDLAGARASATIPISDRLATRLIADELPRSSPVREIELRASAGNTITVALRMVGPAIFPRIEIPVHIEQQPSLPEAPTFVFRVALPRGLAAIAGPALRIFDFLPPGVRMQDDRLIVDLRTVLQRYEAAEALDYLDRLELTTVERAILVRIDARLAPPPTP
jgi:hypothetical protein